MKKVTEFDFWNRINNFGDACWLWGGSVLQSGYGRFGQNEYVHRYSWKLHNGQIPDGIFVCHHCDTKLCVNPDHLFLGTALDNTRDMHSKWRHEHGERHHGAKLKDNDIRIIRSSDGTNKDLAKIFCVTPGLISKIQTRKIWVHI